MVVIDQVRVIAGHQARPCGFDHGSQQWRELHPPASDTGKKMEPVVEPGPLNLP